MKTALAVTGFLLSVIILCQTEPTSHGIDLLGEYPLGGSKTCTCVPDGLTVVRTEDGPGAGSSKDFAEYSIAGKTYKVNAHNGNMQVAASTFAITAQLPVAPRPRLTTFTYNGIFFRGVVEYNSPLLLLRILGQLTPTGVQVGTSSSPVTVEREDGRVTINFLDMGIETTITITYTVNLAEPVTVGTSEVKVKLEGGYTIAVQFIGSQLTDPTQLTHAPDGDGDHDEDKGLLGELGGINLGGYR